MCGPVGMFGPTPFYRYWRLGPPRCRYRVRPGSIRDRLRLPSQLVLSMREPEFRMPPVGIRKVLDLARQGFNVAQGMHRLRTHDTVQATVSLSRTTSDRDCRARQDTWWNRHAFCASCG